MLRQLVYWVTTPERTRAIRMPRRRPETTIERAVARRWGGARSPTSGSTASCHLEKRKSLGRVCALICGVTVVRDVMKVRKQNTEKEFVMHRPTLKKYQLPLDQRLLEFGIDCVRTTP